jgi:hypothetical protein
MSFLFHRNRKLAGDGLETHAIHCSDGTRNTTAGEECDDGTGGSEALDADRTAHAFGGDGLLGSED